MGETTDLVEHPNFGELRKQRPISQSDGMSLRGHALRRFRRNGFGRGPTPQQHTR